MVADSVEPKMDRIFGFAGGEGFHDSHLQRRARRPRSSSPAPAQVFKVKPGQVGQVISITDKVKTLAGSTRMEYRGHDPITLEGAIHLTNICLSCPAQLGLTKSG